MEIESKNCFLPSSLMLEAEGDPSNGWSLFEYATRNSAVMFEFCKISLYLSSFVLFVTSVAMTSLSYSSSVRVVVIF